MGGTIPFDLELKVEPTADGYRIQALSSPVGNGESSTFAAPFSHLEAENFLLKAGRFSDERRHGDGELADVALDFGRRLFEQVLSGEAGRCLRQSAEHAKAEGAELRLRLNLRECPALAQLPWELICVGGQLTDLSEDVTVVRVLAGADEITSAPRSARPPLRILVTRSEPEDQPSLRLNTDWARLGGPLTALASSGQLVVTELANPTRDELHRALADGAFQVLHFTGRAGRDARRRCGLVLSDPAGRGALVSGPELARLLCGQTGLRLAVLDTCVAGRLEADDPYSAVATLLAEHGLPAVIAMQFEISHAAGAELTRALYGALTAGQPVARALADARAAVRAVSPLEWATPVLYLAAADGPVIEADEPAPRPDGRARDRTDRGDHLRLKFRLSEAEESYRAS